MSLATDFCVEGGSQQEKEVVDIKLHFFQMQVIYWVLILIRGVYTSIWLLPVVGSLQLF